MAKGATFGPRELWVGEGVVWVVGVDGALWVDPRRDRPDRWVPFPHDGGEATRGALDVARETGGPDRLERLDARSGRRLGQIDLPERGVARLAEVGQELWVATPGGRILVGR